MKKSAKSSHLLSTAPFLISHRFNDPIFPSMLSQYTIGLGSSTLSSLENLLLSSSRSAIEGTLEMAKLMALAVLDTVAAESHEEEDVRRRDLVKENRSAMERKCDEGLGDMLGA